MRLDRRSFLQSGLAAAALWPVIGSVRAARFETDPFTLGVASGCPRPTGVVIWTRLKLDADPAELSADPFAPVEKVSLPAYDVAWEVARDEAFNQPVAQGIARAEESFAHSVHVEVAGLEPDRWYYYRFRAGEALSPTGRTRTAPATVTDNSRFRLAFASCQQFEQGYYAAYRDMAARDLDLVVHLGDYIYERSYGAELVRKHGTGNPSLLYEYRDRYALYKADANLQAAHAMFPWLVIWDDHEVVNNYAADCSPEDRDPAAFLKRRAAAYQAWYEHMPVPPRAAPRFDDLRIYGHFQFGRLLDLALLDTRQYRSAPAEGGVDAASMLGPEQEAWLAKTMSQPGGRWTILGQQTLLSERDTAAGDTTKFGLDGWDGYQAARGRVLDALAARPEANPIVIGGDLHAFYAADVKADFTRDDAAVVATEFVTGSITSDGPTEASVATTVAENPHLKFVDGAAHGYGILDLSEKSASVAFVTVSDRKDPEATASIAQRFAVLPGAPGVNRA